MALGTQLDMSDRRRRSVITGSATLLTGSFLVSNGAVGADNGSEETNQTNDTDEQELGLKVEVDDSGHVDQPSYTVFELCVRNYGNEPVSVPVTLEIGHIDEEVDTLEIGPGESENDRAGFIHPRSLGPGEHDWTVTAGEETVTGTFVVEADEDYEDRDSGYHISILTPANAEESEIVKETDDGQDTASFWFNIDVMNYRYESVEGERTFEVGDVLDQWSLEFEPREYKQTYASFDLPEGEYEWTATIGEDSISGHIRVVPSEENC